MTGIPWWEIIGWAGSLLVVVSLMVPSVRRFRRLNALGSAIATIYNAVFGIWPYFAMNLVITGIDVYWLWKLRAERNTSRLTDAAGNAEGDSLHGKYALVLVEPNDPLAQNFIVRHSADVKRAYPRLELATLWSATVIVVTRDDELVGFVAVREEGHGRGALLVDWVTERFRDYSPGAFVYASSGLFERLGIAVLELDPSMTADPDYFVKQGFMREGDLLVRDVTAAHA